MKIHITGANGYVGKALVKAGAIPLNCDVTNIDDVEREIEEKKPNLVLHLAAKTDVDYCEKKPNFDHVFAVNIRGTHNIAMALARRYVPSILLSTYHVWTGEEREKHAEDSPLTPAVNRYGMMKTAAETIASTGGMKIIRTSFLFDKQRLLPKIDALLNGQELYEPSFMTRSFLHLNDFVSLIKIYSENYANMPQILHLAGRESCSWYAFMKYVARHYDVRENLVHAKSSEDNNSAPRPRNGTLDTRLAAKLGFPQINFHRGIARLDE